VAPFCVLEGGRGSSAGEGVTKVAVENSATPLLALKHSVKSEISTHQIFCGGGGRKRGGQGREDLLIQDAQGSVPRCILSYACR
jgi:hypothetical protein